MSPRWLFFPAPATGGSPKLTFEGTIPAFTGLGTQQVGNIVWGGTDGGSTNYASPWGPIRTVQSWAHWFEFLFVVQGTYSTGAGWLSSVGGSIAQSDTIVKTGSTYLGPVDSISFVTSSSDGFVRMRFQGSTASAEQNIEDFWTALQAGNGIHITIDW